MENNTTNNVMCNNHFLHVLIHHIWHITIHFFTQQYWLLPISSSSLHYNIIYNRVRVDNYISYFSAYLKNDMF